MWKRLLAQNWLRLSVIAGVPLTGCYNPVVQEGLACTNNESCPIGQTCQSGNCFSSVRPQPRSDAGPRIDASLSGPDAGLCPGSKTFMPTGAPTIVEFTIPSCADIVTIEASGAQGGGTSINANAGGKGARIRGEFSSLGGQTIRVLAGEQGGNGINGVTAIDEYAQGGGTGGGGSFVANSADEPLLVAAGGGGAAYDLLEANPGGPGQITEEAQDGGGDDGGLRGFPPPGIGGGDSFVYPSGATPDAHGGTGGGGFFDGGLLNSNGAGKYGSPNEPGMSFLQGGLGGKKGTMGRDGGFGGGGAAGLSGGGGGGYTGGGAGGYIPAAGIRSGGGGGSFNSGTMKDDSPGANSGDGMVIINW